MTNFVLDKPEVVFVHLPKTGGTSVREALGGSVARRYFGHLPSEFASLPSFSIVREPRERFLSALRMFKYGNQLEGDYYATSRWPDLTVSKALDILEDPWIGHDRSYRSLEWNLKHHLIPQTHPFNSLGLAQRLLRQENLEQDFALFCKEFDLPNKGLKRLRTRHHSAKEELWTSADEKRFDEIFAQDYALLGYRRSSEDTKSTLKAQPINKVSLTTPSIYEAWPSYFSDMSIGNEKASLALPSPTCDLRLFLDEEIPGRPSGSWAGRSKNLVEHFHNLQPEFAGCSRLSHLLVCTIVVLRRVPSCSEASLLFWRILDEHAEAIASELSLRWLVSVADTLADLGRDEAERALGMCASLVANTTKLHETELRLFYPKRPWPPKIRFSSGGELFDGLITFWNEKGDLMDNMFSRVSSVAGAQVPAGIVLNETVARLRKGPTVFRRFARIAGQPSVPVMEESLKEKFYRMFKRRL